MASLKGLWLKCLGRSSSAAQPVRPDKPRRVRIKRARSSAGQPAVAI